MPDSPITILDLIHEDILSTLNGVSTAASYPIDLIVEGIEPGIGNKAADAKAVVIQGGQTPRTEANSISKDHWDVEFTVECEAYASQTEGTPSDTPIITKLNRIWASVVYALCGTESSRGRGSYAVDTAATGADYDLESTTERGGKVTCTFSIWYVTARGNPFSQ